LLHNGSKETELPTLTLTLDDVLNPSEQTLILQALHRLLEVKQDAFNGLADARKTGEPMLAGHRPFEASDFAIPQIQALIERFNA
jgi:hypothetical protein